MRAQDLLLGASEQPEEGYGEAQVLERGLKLVLDGLDQTAVDVPFAPELVRTAVLSQCASSCLSRASWYGSPPRAKWVHDRFPGCSRRLAVLGLPSHARQTCSCHLDLAWQRICVSEVSHGD